MEYRVSLLTLMNTRFGLIEERSAAYDNVLMYSVSNAKLL